MTTRILSFSLTLAGLLFASAPSAADGDLLAGYGTDAEFPGMGFYPSPYASDEHAWVTRLDSAPGGGLLLIGSMNTDTGSRASVYRLTAMGYADHDFGTAGLRTYAPPCPDGVLADAAVDAGGRTWLAFRGCGDFSVYRLTASGDLDTSLLGSGVLTIAFDQGGGNDDAVRRILPDGNGGLIMAGNAEQAAGRRLALAHVTDAGAPQPGFGTDGTVTLAMPESSILVRGLHRMDDGRIVVVGDYAPNPTLSVLMAVRVHAGGVPDAGFGNHGPGVSRADHAALLGQLNNAVRSSASLLDRDGSVWVAGDTLGGGTSALDMTLVKFRPDGQLDTGIGAHGFRRYALDFAGANPVSDIHNSDRARQLLRQGDGKLVLVGESRGADGHQGISVLRLRRDLEPDPSFGTAGKVRYVLPIEPGGNHHAAAAVALLQPGRLLVAGHVDAGQAMMQMSVGLDNDLLYADTFD